MGKHTRVKRGLSLALENKRERCLQQRTRHTTLLHAGITPKEHAANSELESDGLGLAPGAGMLQYKSVSPFAVSIFRGKLL